MKLNECFELFSAEIFFCFQAKNLIFRLLLSELKYNPCSYTPMSPLFSIHLPPSNFFYPKPNLTQNVI